MLTEGRESYLFLRDLLARKRHLRVHAMGVCGVGLSGVAALLQARGWEVSGCDVNAACEQAEWLAAHGIAVRDGHEPAHLSATCDLLVRSAAVAPSHPEVQRAHELGIPVVRRGEMLAALLSARRGVAVCGTHGKTTTACFTTRLFQALGAAPGWCIGGSVPALAGVADAGGAGPLVVEADESDGTLALYEPAITVVTNIDADHMEHFGGLEALSACFAGAVANTREGVVYGADDAAATAVCAAAPGAIGFGFDPAARLRIASLDMNADRMRLEVLWDGVSLGQAELRVTGRHNALNACGALGAAIAAGYAPQVAFAALAALDELPGRRFEQVAVRGGIRVISDYSHHPAEIAALVALARLQDAQRLVAIFQPHRYSRTRALAEVFPAAFRGVAELLLAPVYAASEEPLEGGRIEDLYRAFRAQAGAGIPLPRLAASLEAAWHWLRRHLRPGDLLLVVGAGDVEQVARWAASEYGQGAIRAAAPVAADAFAGIAGVTVRLSHPLGPLTTLGVGGPAEALLDVDTPEALSAALRVCRERGYRRHLLAGGSNTLVDDLGVRGVVLRLHGQSFRGWHVADGRLTAGCGWGGSALLERMTSAGLGGLEFLDGIPGRLGGWLAMNAGAHGGEIGTRVRALHCVDSDGAPFTVSGADAGFGYRRCAVLAQAVAVGIELDLAPDDPAAVAARRQAYRQRRLNLAGLRTAGSVFRNPPGEAAGRLLDLAGCKGLRVGGARVFEGHANVIALDADAAAADMLALMALMRDRVRSRHGVELAAEIRHLR
ncbi:MAG: UDP-N-acetylmuramate--L-alanine ligase [Kiritimatiellae bacterium]|nr:UDP-N-acetylmuramate--L-alanine ligase [Kiritimatiellia bacterium]